MAATQQRPSPKARAVPTAHNLVRLFGSAFPEPNTRTNTIVLNKDDCRFQRIP
jgi:hypothetical protein